METNYKQITYQNNNVSILQYLSETDNQFNKRLDFIKKLEKSNINWKEANRLSRIWYCIKFKSCKYIPEVYHMIVKYDKM